MPFTCISVAEATDLIDKSDATVIDIRDPNSFSAGHIPSSTHVTNENVQEFIDKANFAKPLIVCCYHGNMSKGAADYFSNAGFQDTYSLDGGYTKWAEVAG
jgi:thiosulfate sulfurtransferase